MSEPIPDPAREAPVGTQAVSAATASVEPARGSMRAPPAAEFESYKPLSLLAIAGFALACAWAARVLLGWLGVLLGNPLGPPVWSLLLAVPGAVLSVLAAAQVIYYHGFAGGSSPDTPPPRLALLGLALSALWALFLVVALAIGLFSRTPLALNALILLVPVAGAVLTLAAAARARRVTADQPRDGDADPSVFWKRAVAGLVLTGLWVLAVSVGRIVEIFTEKPLLLPAWYLVFPLAGAGLSLAARLQIQRSEGTLAGAALARWGLALSVVVGLCYWGYYFAIYLAVRQQTDEFAQVWFDLLKTGRPAAAFRLTLEPGLRRGVPEAGDPSLRGVLEARFNLVEQGPDGPQGGRLSRFFHAPAVRSLIQGGPNTQIQSLGAAGDWDFKDRGYLVRQNYRLTTDEATLDLSLQIHGKRGQWQVRWNESFIMEDPQTRLQLPTPTARGRQLQGLSADGFRFAREWIAKLGHNEQFRQAIQQTVDPTSTGPRHGAGLLLTGCLAANLNGGWFNPVGLIAWAGVDADLAQRLHLCGLLQVKDDDFFAAPEMRKQAPEEVRRLFLLAGSLPPPAVFPMGVNERLLPYWRQDGGRLRVEYDCELRPTPKILAEAVLTIETDAAALESNQPPKWRVTGLRLIRAREPAMPGPRAE